MLVVDSLFTLYLKMGIGTFRKACCPSLRLRSIREDKVLLATIFHAGVKG